MKRFMMSVLFPVLGFLLLFADCAGASEYFPLLEGFSTQSAYVVKTSGRVMEGLIEGTVLPNRNLEGQALTPLKASLTLTSPVTAKVGDYYSFYLVDEQGIRIAAEQEPDEKTPRMLKREDWELKYPLVPGRSWVQDDELELSNQKFSVSVTNTIESMEDTVTVKAGTFENCMKIKKHFNGKVNLGSYGGNAAITIEGERWYAPGVGEIKACQSTKSDREELTGDICVELQSFQQSR